MTEVDERAPPRIAYGLFECTRDQDFAGFRGVFTQLTGGVHFGAPQLGVACAQDVSVAKPDAQQNLFLGPTPQAHALTLALHGERAGKGGLGVTKHDEETVCVGAQHDAIVLFDDWIQQQAMLVDDL